MGADLFVAVYELTCVQVDRAERRLPPPGRNGRLFIDPLKHRLSYRYGRGRAVVIVRWSEPKPGRVK
jgi:hypothetical protein